MTGYRIKIKRGNKWRVGIVSYSTFEEAQERANHFSSMGSKAVVCDFTGLEVNE